MIETQGLTRRFGAKVALDSLDLRIEPGTIFGFLGQNGAGKTTTVKILTGLLRPDAGRAMVAGHDVLNEPEEVKRRLGYVPESGTLYENLTAAEYLGLVANLHHLDPSIAASRREEFLSLFGILDDQHQRMTGFSKGMKQKVILSAALLHRPEVILLDEPLNGLDATAAMIVKELLKRLAAQGRTILFCSHILEVVERVCTRIMVIDQGKRVVEGTVAEICAQTESTALEDAFRKLTGLRDAGQVTDEFLAALDKV